MCRSQDTIGAPRQAIRHSDVHLNEDGTWDSEFCGSDARESRAMAEHAIKQLETAFVSNRCSLSSLSFGFRHMLEGRAFLRCFEK